MAPKKINTVAKKASTSSTPKSPTKTTKKVVEEKVPEETPVQQNPE